ncbi:hypothetical protein [uncultured Corynebacterium sp.]|uniref:hypothetical protein n=1 Tax=uncultured Corynebacterium sp. TaxID=159447 RepID=UPI0025EA8F6F|nr:hypothetical protein [uncultured Corynebacterium sp.]
MDDPTRIDPTLESLRRAWEGQPDLSLPTFFAMLANRGIGWGASDTELVAELERQAAVHPPLLPLEGGRVAAGEWLVLADAPAYRITATSTHIIVRRPDTQPVVWAYNSIRPTGPGRPFTIRDTEGFEHRFGVVSILMRLNTERPNLEGLKRQELGDYVFVLRFCETIGVLDHGLHLFAKQNRRVTRQDYSWQRIEKCRPGEELEMILGGGESARLGTVQEILVAETPNPLFG